MKYILCTLVCLNLSLYADSSELKQMQEKERLCKIFTQKATTYAKNMRNDELAHITLESYKNRANIFCNKKPKEIASNNDKNKTKKNESYIHDISKEDARLCKIFEDKYERYKKHMRSDELAKTTLESYKKRMNIFCSRDMLEKKEAGVLTEDKKLCNVFKQGPVILKKVNKEIKLSKNDPLAKETVKSFNKREKVFCSSKPLNKKDAEVYAEHVRLCKLYNQKINMYQKNMRDDAFAKATLNSYKKRAAYFCSKGNNTNKE